VAKPLSFPVYLRTAQYIIRMVGMYQYGPPLIFILLWCVLNISMTSALFPESYHLRRNLASFVSFNSNLTYCKPNEIMPGKWVRQNLTEKLYVSCGKETNDWQDPEINQYCTTEGRISNDIDRGPKENLTIVGGHASVCDEMDKTRLIPSQREQYIWQPDNCQLMKWDARLFCKLLGNRNLMFFGDSTMQQTFASFINRINWGKDRAYCAHQLTFAVAFGISLPYEKELERWDRIILLHNPDIIVAGFGGHFTRFGDNMGPFNHTVRALYQLLNHTAHIRNESRLHFIWKTNNPGHVLCDDYTEPTNYYPHQSPELDKYKWGYFPKYDEIYENFRSTQYFGMFKNSTLNMEPLYFRPDAHAGKRAWDWHRTFGGDCLHLCAPGALDVAPIFFMHWMLHND